MSGRLELWMFALQRLSAMVLAPLVLIHLGTMIYAVQGGLSASEILSRTQANAIWPVLYGIFIVAVAVHGAIGLLHEPGHPFAFEAPPRLLLGVATREDHRHVGTQRTDCLEGLFAAQARHRAP